MRRVFADQSKGAGIIPMRQWPSNAALPGPMSSPFITETVLDVRHWTESYFSFTTTRDDGFRFDNGQFVMIGLEANGRPLMRAYSMASGNWEEQLEFFSIKVPDGPLTSRLQHIQPGDSLLISRKPTGTLLISDLLPGDRKSTRLNSSHW